MSLNLEQKQAVVAEVSEVISGAKLEPSLANAGPGTHYQFERLGYFSWSFEVVPDKW